MPYASSHDVDIYYEIYGKGERTLVFAHGMGGNAAIWFNQVATFMSGYRVIVFDHRYFARSMCAESDFKPELFADDIMAVMAAENVDSGVFVCQSMGGWTGSQMAVHHPEKVDGLVMSHTPGIFFNESAVNNRDVNKLVSKPMSSLGSAALAVDYPKKNLAGALLYAQISGFNRIDPAAIPRGIGKANIGVNTASLGDYKIPTLFVTADKDVLFPSSFIETLAKTLPGAQCVNLGDAGHSSYFEIPDKFNQALSEFLATF
jgi:3-oxoadipate enol-lactonase